MHNTTKMNELFEQWINGEISLYDVRNELHPAEFELIEAWIDAIPD